MLLANDMANISKSKMNIKKERLETPDDNRQFNLVELAGSVGASGVTHYKIRPLQPSPQAMNRAAKWRGQQNLLTV